MNQNRLTTAINRRHIYNRDDDGSVVSRGLSWGVGKGTKGCCYEEMDRLSRCSQVSSCSSRIQGSSMLFPTSCQLRRSDLKKKSLEQSLSLPQIPPQASGRV